MGSAERLPGREHIPSYPKGWVVLRIFQLVFSIIITGLCAYSISLSRFPWVGPCLMLFTCLVTLGISIWLTCAHSCAPHAFNYWAALAFDVFLYIFWLASFAIVAIDAAAVFALGSYDNYDGDFDDYYHSYGLNRTGVIHASILAAAAGLGALEFLFFFISWVTDAVVIHRHRKAGLHCKPLKRGSSSAVMMQPQTKPAYEAVPQQGMPFTQQETAYNPQQMYNPPPAQSFTPQRPYYGQQQNHQHGGYPPVAASLASQPTGGPFHQPVSPAPAQSPYQVPYAPQTSYDPTHQHHHQSPYQQGY